VKGLREEGTALAGEVQDLRKEANDLKVAVANLERAGFTKKVMTELKHSWVKNEDEALSVLHDKKKALEAQSTVQQLAKEEASVKSRVNSLERKEHKVAKKLASEENRLDRIRSETLAAQKAISVVEAALRRGYTPNDLISVFVWLERMEIQKQPICSIERLLEFFAEAKNLSNLKHEKLAVENEVEELREVASKLKADTEIQKVMTIRSFQEQTEKSSEAIASVATKFREEAMRIISEMANRSRAANEVVASSMQERAKIEEQIRRLQPALALFRISPPSDLLKTISPKTGILLLENARSRVQKRFPNAKTMAIYDLVAGEFISNPLTGTFMNVEVFLKFYIECIRRLLAEEETERQSG
jgi:hypothetical protein